MPKLVRLWESLHAVKLEAPGLLYKYETFGLSHCDLVHLIGVHDNPGLIDDDQ